MTVLVAFAGSGDTSEANIAALLNDRLPQTMEPPVIPVVIKRAQTGLKRTAAWLVAEFGEENVDEVPVKEILQLLTEATKRGDEALLCYIPAEAWKEDSDEARLVRGCIEHGIPVLNLALGLADFVPPEEEPQSDEASQGGGPHVPATRGRPRSPQADAPADPWADTGGESNDREEPAQRQEEPTVSVSLSDGSVELRASTLQALLAFAGSLAEDIKASVITGRLVVPTQEETSAPSFSFAEARYQFWLHEDGEYRPRVGRGRGKQGETMVELNAAEVRNLGLEIPR